MASKDLVKGYCKESKCEYDVYTKEKIDELLGDIYNSSSTYKVGDLVIYNNSLYKCNTDIATAEEWNASHWTLSTLSKELKSIDGNPTVLWTGEYNFSTNFDDRISLSSSIKNFDCIEVITDRFGSQRFFNNKGMEVGGAFGGILQVNSSSDNHFFIKEEIRINIATSYLRATEKQFMKYMIGESGSSPTITCVSEDQVGGPANVVKVVGYKFS